MMPATRLPSVWRAAKPTMAATSTLDATSEPAMRPRPANCESAASTPTRSSTSQISRRTKRSRVSVCWLTRPRSTWSAIRRPRAANQRSKTTATITKKAKMTTARIHAFSAHQSSSVADMPPQTRCLLLDAMGTLLTFQPPAPRLRAALRAVTGADVGEEAARRAIRAEIAYYRAHLHLGSDAAGLERLRREAAAAMRPELPDPAAGLPPDVLVGVLLDALRFHAYPEVPSTLRELRRRGFRLVVVSNWDVSLHERLDELGLTPLLDGAVASAEFGAAKPDRTVFEHALALAGAEAAGSWHAGDSVEADVEGALGAGLTPVLVARHGQPAPPGVTAVAALD